VAEGKRRGAWFATTETIDEFGVRTVQRGPLKQTKKFFKESGSDEPIDEPKK
jgi:hypothetical protein